MMSEYTTEDMWEAYKFGCSQPRDVNHPNTRGEFELWLAELDYEKSETLTVLEALELRIKPSYVGWGDQYKAVLTALNIPLDMPMADLQELLKMYEEEDE